MQNQENKKKIKESRKNTVLKVKYLKIKNKQEIKIVTFVIADCNNVKEYTT